MTRRIVPSTMLETARRLAGAGAGAGRPALSDLRRATSTAYYALFHQILRHGSIDFLGPASEDEIADIARWFTHKGVHDAAELVILAAGDRPTDTIKRERRQGVRARITGSRTSSSEWLRLFRICRLSGTVPTMTGTMIRSAQSRSPT